MITRVLIACLACFVTNVQALPVVFTNTAFDTSAVALAEGVADFNSDASPPSPLPLVTSATAVGQTDFASGNGIAAQGLLSTLAEASSLAGVASGVGSSRFQGDFTGGGVFGLHFDFDSTDATSATAQSSGSLFLLLSSLTSGTTLLDEIFSVSGPFDVARFIPVGDYRLELLLSSEANTTAGGDASNFASVTFAQPTLVPEPATWALMLLGMLLLCVQASRYRSQQWHRVRSSR